MKTVLLGWELGRHFGHITDLARIAASLEQYCKRFVFVLKETRHADLVIRNTMSPEADIIILEMPGQIQKLKNPQKSRTGSRAEIFSHLLFPDKEYIRHELEGWRKILHNFSPGLVIADSAPYLVLAAKGFFPVIAIGNGYTLPPKGKRLPRIEELDRTSAEEILAVENKTCQRINQVLDGSSSIQYISDVFHGEESFVLTLSWLDPYNGFRDERVWPPLDVTPDIAQPDISLRPERSVYVYLPGRRPILQTIMRALIHSDLEVFVFLPDLEPGELEHVRKPNITVLEQPPSLPSILPRVRTFISHAGLGSATHGILTATPQLLLQSHSEQSITARRIAGLSMGFVCTSQVNVKEEQIFNALGHLLHNMSIRDNCRRHAEQAARECTVLTIDEIKKSCLKYLQ